MQMIHIGDYTVPAYTSQMTTPSLKIRTSDGSMFYVPTIAEDMCIATGNTELYYEETDINTCKEITLPAGCWRVELSGGFGQGLCGSDDDIYQTGATETYTLRLNTETQIYVFRGGDGNAPAAYVAGTGIGGGASGVDSFIVVKNQIKSAAGGGGELCQSGNPTYSTEFDSNNLQCNLRPGYGGGGSPDRAGGQSGHNNTDSACKIFYGAGGGGAPSGKSGSQATLNDARFVATAPTAASVARGGNGAGIKFTDTDGTTIAATGGRGGETQSWTCGGHTVYSYGGGGGGATCWVMNENSSVTCNSGTDGGSGSTGTSDTSYVKIYRL